MKKAYSVVRNGRFVGVYFDTTAVGAVGRAGYALGFVPDSSCVATLASEELSSTDWQFWGLHSMLRSRSAHNYADRLKNGKEEKEEKKRA